MYFNLQNHLNPLYCWFQVKLCLEDCSTKLAMVITWVRYKNCESCFFNMINFLYQNTGFHFVMSFKVDILDSHWVVHSYAILGLTVPSNMKHTHKILNDLNWFLLRETRHAYGTHIYVEAKYSYMCSNLDKPLKDTFFLSFFFLSFSFLCCLFVC